MSDKVIKEELRKLGGRRQNVQPRQVVDAARDERHPLHNYFDWDNTSAGDSWRLWQARMLIQRVKLRVEHEDRVIEAPYYVRDQRVPDGHPGYAPIEVFSNRKDLARQVVAREIARVESALDRARAASMVLGIEKEFQRVARDIVPRLQQLLREQRQKNDS